MDEMVPFGDFFDDLDEMRKKLDKIFTRVPFQTGRIGKELSGEWYPAVDLEETDSEIIIKAELPGILEKDVSLDATAHSLTLSGQRREYSEIEDKKAGYIRRERSFGKFSRYFALPAKVDPDKAEAKFKDGVLEVKLPKAEPGKPRGKRIDINRD